MENNFFMQVGNNIQRFLNAQGITQQALSTKLGISKQVMSKIITGAKAINVEEIRNIASALNVSIDSLLSIEIEPESIHNFAFMGKLENDNTKRKIEHLMTIIDEILMLEEYANAD